MSFCYKLIGLILLLLLLLLLLKKYLFKAEIIVHYECTTFTFYMTSELDEYDDKQFDEFIDKITLKFNLKEKVFKIYEGISGKRIYCDDWDDLSEMLEDVEDAAGETKLHLYIGLELDNWCQTNGFSKYYEKLKEFGFVSLDDFMEQNDDDINELCNELGIKYVIKNKFKQAVKQLTDNEEIQTRDLPPGFSIANHTKTEYIVPKSIGKASKQLCISATQHAVYKSDSKTMLVIGESGAGKTTLINGMMNYIYNIKYEDKYRLRLIEEKTKQCLQAESQTDNVSVYQVPKPEFDSNIDYNLNIIDTPGFGDTRGIFKDAEILLDLRYLLDNTLNGIDAICFVMKSTTNRLTSAQQYVFNSVLNLWSKDIQPNMFVLLTFCEGKNPQIINSLSQHPQFNKCENIFKFNNTAYCHDPTSEKTYDGINDGLSDQFNKIYWKMSDNGFKSFFNVLNNTQAKSTNNSRNVLRQRAKIDNKIEIILNEKHHLLHQTQKIVQNQKLINKYNKQINYNKQQKRFVKHMETVKEYKNYNTVTNCNNCKKTCHKNCDKSDIKTCCVMNKDYCCDICGCHFTEHENCNYIWTRKAIIDATTNWNQFDGCDLKIQYDEAIQSKYEAEDKIQKALLCKQEIQNNIKNKINDILKYVTYLDKEALRPKLSTVGDYIDQVFQNNSDLSKENMKRLKRIKKKEDIMYEIELQWKLVGTNMLAMTRSESINDCICNEEFTCICGNPFEMMSSERCTNGGFISCNICDKLVDDIDMVYHCVKQSATHPSEYNLCFKCVLKNMMLHEGISDPFCGKLHLDKLWKRYDKDGNGKIDQVELEELIYAVLSLFCIERNPNMPLKSRKECDTFVRKIALNLKPQLDTNGNGVISREEFELFGEYFAVEYNKLQKELAINLL